MRSSMDDGVGSGSGWLVRLDGLEREGIGALGERQGDAGDGGGGAVLGGEDDAVVAIAAKIEVGIAPGMELGGAAQGLAGADGAAPFLAWWTTATATAWRRCRSRRKASTGATSPLAFSSMRCRRTNGSRMSSRGFRAATVSSRRPRSVSRSRRRLGAVITWTSSVGEAAAGGGADAVKAAADDVQRVLGGIEQDATGARHREAAQAGSAGGDRDGEVQRQEGFAALRFAADDADGFIGPQAGDQPMLLLGAIGEAMGRLDGKRGHRRRRIAALASPAVAAAQTSKNRVSSIWRASRWAAATSSSSAMIISARRLPWAWSQRAAITSGGHQRRHAGLLQGVAEAFLQVLRRGAFHRQAHAHAAVEGEELVGTQAVGKPPVAGQHDGEQDARIEFGGGQQAQLREDGGLDFLRLVDDEHGPGQGGIDIGLPALAQHLGAGPAVVRLEFDAEQVAHLAVEVGDVGLRAADHAELDVALRRQRSREDAQGSRLAGAGHAGDEGKTTFADELAHTPAERTPRAR